MEPLFPKIIKDNSQKVLWWIKIPKIKISKKRIKSFKNKENRKRSKKRRSWMGNIKKNNKTKKNTQFTIRWRRKQKNK